MAYHSECFKFSRKHGQGERESDRGGGFQGAWISVDVVAEEMSSQFGSQLQVLCQVLAQHGWQELAVGHVLDLGRDQTPRLLIEGLVVPHGVDPGQFSGQPVVLADKERVEDHQGRTIVDSGVTRFHAIALVAVVVEQVATVVHRQQITKTRPQQSTLEGPQLISRVQAASVDGGGVQESRGSVQLLPGTQLAFPVQDADGS